MKDIILPDIGTIVEIETGVGRFLDMPHATEKHMGFVKEAKQNEKYSMFLSYTLSYRNPADNVSCRFSKKRPFTYDCVREHSTQLILVPGKPITEEELFEQPQGMKILLHYSPMDGEPEGCTPSIQVVGYLEGPGFSGGINLARTNEVSFQKLNNVHTYPLKNSFLPPPHIFLLEEK